MKDARFTCPNCGREIELKELVASSNVDITDTPIAAVCQPCRRVYTAEQWRKFYGPGGRSGEGGGTEAWVA